MNVQKSILNQSSSRHRCIQVISFQTIPVIEFLMAYYHNNAISFEMIHLLFNEIEIQERERDKTKIHRHLLYIKQNNKKPIRLPYMNVSEMRNKFF